MRSRKMTDRMLLDGLVNKYGKKKITSVINKINENTYLPNIDYNNVSEDILGDSSKGENIIYKYVSNDVGICVDGFGSEEAEKFLDECQDAETNKNLIKTYSYRDKYYDNYEDCYIKDRINIEVYKRDNGKYFFPRLVG